MLALLLTIATTALVVLLWGRWLEREAEQWVAEQKAVANFAFAQTTITKERLALRAEANAALKAAFGIDNSLTTDCPLAHRAFLKKVSQLLKQNRSWVKLYSIAESFLEAEIRAAVRHGKHMLPLAESVRCMCLLVVLFDNFGVDPASIPREKLVIITHEINQQWLRSKCDRNVSRSALLDKTIDSLGLTTPPCLLSPREPAALMTSAEALSLLMPQYETLWRVVLLTFVTAYHYQVEIRKDVEQRTAGVPVCLGDPASENEALTIAKEGLRLYPSNKHLYRTHPNHDPSKFDPNTNSQDEARASKPASCAISVLHRRRSIWGPNALAFRPSRFDKNNADTDPKNNNSGIYHYARRLSPIQKEAYMPFSIGPHACPARGNNGLGNRMVTCLVVALGRVLGGERAMVVGLWGSVGKKGELPTGRDELEEWRWTVLG